MPDYQTRPNKFIDRYLFVRIVSYLSRIYDIEKYTYIGFGSYQFEDFKLIHNQLDIQKMVSLESDLRVCERACFNRPYSCIDIINTTSKDFIEDIKPRQENTIIWLDYTDPSKMSSQFTDFCGLLEKLNPNDIIRITLNASASSLGEKALSEETNSLYERRFSRLNDRIGKFLPSEASKDLMHDGGYPLILLKSLQRAANKTLTYAPPYQNRFLLPLSASVYKDGQQMITVTGILLDGTEKEQEIKQCLRNCSFATFAWERPFAIRVPSLTAKELFVLNSKMPSPDARKSILTEFSKIFDEKEIDNYLEYYKYYPSFHHVSL